MADIFDTPDDDIRETLCCVVPGCKGHVQFSHKKYDVKMYSQYEAWGPEACDVCGSLHTRYYDEQCTEDYADCWDCPYVELCIT